MDTPVTATPTKSPIITSKTAVQESLSISNNGADENIIEKLRSTREDIFIKLTRMHLLFNIDAGGDSLASLFDEKSNQCEGSKVINDELIQCMNRLITFISQDSNIIQEGIFRRCGSLVRQQELKSKLVNGIKVDLEDGPYNVHDCANVLKALLSELSQPLLTDIFFKINCEISGFTVSTSCDALSPSKKTKKLKKLQLLLLLLPINVHRFVQNLLKLLAKASSHSDSNRMDSRNLSTLFAPHLLFPKDLKASEIHQHLIILTDELKFMIDHVDIIFDPPKELLLDAKREYQKLERGEATEDDVVDTVLTFCSRDNIPQQSETEKHLAELYAYISSMPETPKKRNLIKQFNRQNGGITPLSVKKDDSVKGKASHVMKAMGKGLRKGLNLFPSSRGGTPKTPKLSKSYDTLSDTPLKASTRTNWSSDTNLTDREQCSNNLKDFSSPVKSHRPDDISSPNNHKKPKVNIERY